MLTSVLCYNVSRRGVLFMEQFVTFISQKETIITIAIIIVLFILYLLYSRINRNMLIKKLHQLEVNINSMRSTPISYKLNKAVGLSKVNENVIAHVEKAQEEFAELTSSFETLTHLLGNAEDNILTGKHRQGKAILKEIESLYTTTNQTVLGLNSELENMLQDETRLRDDINFLKNDFRRIRQDYTSKSNTLAIASTTIEQKIDEIELKFNSFEEWMFASEYSNAQQEFLDIQKESIALDKALKTLPTHIEKANGIIPHLVDEISKNFQVLSDKGVFLGHLEVSKNINLITDHLKEDINNIKQLNIEESTLRLDESIKRLQQLQTQMNKEEKAFDLVEGFKATSFNQQQMVNDELLSLNNSLSELNARFGFNQLSEAMPKYLETNNSLKKKANSLLYKLENEQIPFTTLLVEFNEFNQDVSHLQQEVQEANRLVHSATQDEARAENQLLKLNLLMNDIQTKIEERHLPHISDTYEGDVTKANQMIFQIKKILSQNPLNINLLNTSVHETIDFIYRLYNNVNNLVGTVDMVENAIVYANKYRSSSPELDSELTRAEISFRNGEYTYALTTAIYAIEKFRPGAKYEDLILQNSKSA